MFKLRLVRLRATPQGLESNRWRVARWIRGLLDRRTANAWQKRQGTDQVAETDKIAQNGQFGVFLRVSRPSRT